MYFVLQNGRMLANLRNRRIVELLEQQGELTVSEACGTFGISEATARRAFVHLVSEGLAEKTWGGVRITAEKAADGASGMRPSAWRFEENRGAKQAIAEHAVGLVHEGDVVFIDGGTTTFHLAGHLAEKSVRIVTNSLLIAHEIDRLRRKKEGAEVFVTGGFLYPRNGLLVGPEAVAAVRRYRATVAFLSVGGITCEGFFNNHQLVVEVEKAMLEHSVRRYVLADSTKFGREEMVAQCGWEDCDKVISNDRPEGFPAHCLEKIELVGVVME